jgi:hypothetical protein
MLSLFCLAPRSIILSAVTPIKNKAAVAPLQNASNRTILMPEKYMYRTKRSRKNETPVT